MVINYPGNMKCMSYNQSQKEFTDTAGLGCHFTYFHIYLVPHGPLPPAPNQDNVYFEREREVQNKNLFSSEGMFFLVEVAPIFLKLVEAWKR